MKKQIFTEKHINDFRVKYKRSMESSPNFVEVYNVAIKSLMDAKYASNVKECERTLTICLQVANFTIKTLRPDMKALGNLAHLAVATDYMSYRGSHLLHLMDGAPKNPVPFEGEMIMMPPPSKDFMDIYTVMRADLEDNTGLVLYHPGIVTKIIDAVNNTIGFINEYTFINEDGALVMNHKEPDELRKA